jgi:thiol:disulfide interchange protein DsbG
VQHVTSAGAVLTGLGESHGMRAVAARRGDQFMLFEVTPDGQAAVSGATVELTPDQLETIASGNITDLGVEHGLQSFFVRSGPQFQVFYTTPDKERLIPGVMWDVRGKDLTRQQIAHIPGAVPTVVVGRRRAPGVERHSSCCRSLPLVQKASFGTIGPASASQLFMLVDPQCIYSFRALQMLQLYVAGGRLQVSIVPLSVRDHEDQGQSTRSALGLLSKPTSWSQPGRPGASTTRRARRQQSDCGQT